MYELSDTELDMVAGGAPPFIQAGDFIAVGIQVTDVLSHNQVDIHNFLNGNNVQVAAGIAVAVLSGATGVGVLNKLP